MIYISIAILILLVIMSIEDWKEMKIRNSYILLLWGFCLVGCFLCWKQGVFFFDRTCIGISAGFLFLGISILSKEQVGIGDGMVITALGFCFSESVWFILSVAVFVLFIVSLYLCLIKKKEKTCKVPFIPAITFGYTVSFLLTFVQGASM